jgi:hypothetical protein
MNRRLRFESVSRVLALALPLACASCSSDDTGTSQAAGSGGSGAGESTGGSGPGPGGSAGSGGIGVGGSGGSGGVPSGTGGVGGGTGGATGGSGGTPGTGGTGGGLGENTDALCANTLDDDGDTYVDCDDFDCKAPGLTACQEDCDNGVDDDGDGNTDCEDWTCNGQNGGPIDAACMAGATKIQDVQDGTISTGQVVTIENVFVTASHVSASGNYSLYVQEAQGVTTAGHTYPEYAGVEVFANAMTALDLPAIVGLVPGDCVTFTGTTTEFNGGTEVATLTAFTKSATPQNCGTMPTPFVIPGAVAFTDICTDADGVTAGDQAGPLAETYEAVLVEVDGLTAQNMTDMNGDFRVTQGTTDTLLIENFLYGAPIPATSGQTFTKITGILAEFNNYRLNPRGPADIVP